MRIKRFGLKPGVTKAELKAYGFRFSERLHDTPGYYNELSFKDPVTRLKFSIEVWISNNLANRFNDFDNITVYVYDYDEECRLIYASFYSYFDKEAEESSVIATVMENYNSYLSSLPILVELNENEDNKQEGAEYDR